MYRIVQGRVCCSLTMDKIQSGYRHRSKKQCGGYPVPFLPGKTDGRKRSGFLLVASPDPFHNMLHMIFHLFALHLQQLIKQYIITGQLFKKQPVAVVGGNPGIELG